MKNMIKGLLAATALTAAAGLASAETQGVTDDEVVIGAVNDLSGIFAAVGVPATKGANVYFDKVNAAGGVHGRKIRYVVEDHGYQMPRAMQGFNKLLNRDKVFAMMQNLGTPMNLAGFKLIDPLGIPNIAPLSAARQMIQDPMQNKFTSFSSYFDQSVVGVKYLVAEYGAKNVCSMYLPTDFGKEILEGTKAGAEEAGAAFVAETTHKPDETDFVGSLSKLKESGCEIVTIALGVRQAITIVGTAKKMGLTDMQFMGTSASFLTVVAQVPGGVTEGFYAAASWQDLWARADEPAPKAFIEEYKAATGEDPQGFAMLGYAAAQQMVMALEAAGRDLTHESFIAAMESLDYQDDLVGNHINYGPDDHQGADSVYVLKVENGGWAKVHEE
ncbi:ABC transporter substrate-binding protein [Ruegeria pomeroyi]|jgi:branched-chain amino acid transport system substrate-binding protein|uniref:Branched-chain amino acid ABC transporter, periplasmic substrate-binding protein n=2 Tax=Ruegeria pomeroyi TaxID=89184 RepID=Q5LSC2_RUEPO|nr:ABC transporter substrate-binding protein [Ruegeria pomeroyi]HCE70548.1 branched-chain amino acid ABC transporter substrate-binding protein [Ruegeria sp.]AAV95125.1 branched-chain amino acid ABC transporter, periplasmic substrate-binding protein [Ruegeria pomeroyi DSS-3]NVK99356.1 ABC transporter substrate-binding protein [Ruegeria pomeroyi]NVL00323.1 ABC transporter substrate-binding protein [Ruegeria pomeroyi]QWV08699.1 ABC transporter substrate-binding protein [Ruegeria pomeroyi]